MSDLVHRLRSWSLTPHLARDVQEAAARIEALEATLQKIAWLMEGDEDISEIACAALAGLPKTILDEPTSPPEQEQRAINRADIRGEDHRRASALRAGHRPARHRLRDGGQHGRVNEALVTIRKALGHLKPGEEE